MTEARYHFYRVRPGEAPKWWSSRTNRSGLMQDWIDDLGERYRVVRHAEQENTFLLLDRTA